MFKYKKIILYILALIFILLTLFELIIYFNVDNTIYGMIYLLLNIFIIFLLLPVTYNYNKKYNPARISKLVIIILLGIFNSFILSKVVLNNVNYTDDSLLFIKKVAIYKNYLKPIVYFGLLVITFFETKLKKIIKKSISKKVD